MSLIFITGISTSGKSTAAKELTKLGHEAHDLEHNGISAWFHKEKGTRDAEFAQVPDRSKEWDDAHEWRVSIDWVRATAARAVNSLVFLCGGGANEHEIIELSDKVIWLKTDEQTIRSRVNIPRDHTYGTVPHELAAAIDGNLRKEAEYERIGAIMIDARRPLDVVLHNIIRVATI